MAGRESFRATKTGIDLVDERRIKRGWTRKAANFAQAAHVGVGTLARFWDRSRRLDKVSIMGIFQAVGIHNWQDYVESAEASEASGGSRVFERSEASKPGSQPQIREGLPECPVFYGRSKDLTLLSGWVQTENYRVLAILGIGGLGKTAFAIKLVEMLLPQSDGVIWRSMQNAPLLPAFIAELLESLTDAPSITSRPIDRLIKQLQQQRILLVFDGWEALQGGGYAGVYREPYQDYALLLDELGRQPHKSCVIITSREKQKNLTLLGGSLRSHWLPGLEPAEAFQLLERKGLGNFATPEAEELVKRYRGNPLALQLAASVIRDQFGGNIAGFLAEKIYLDEELENILAQQTRSLSDSERYSLSVLAEAAEPIDREALCVRLSPVLSSLDCLKVLDSLERRSLMERTIELGQVLYSLQPMVRRHVQQSHS
ncbi:MAG: NACHT domain-containing protein [Pegethrix bostrychoides GSE-TBD4-15B]|jgi:hypothetical protein|uniref:NACHT domain-containing protein n=1 Tax=Pegethrix bostrychoides GSE-TBD4-15B TaxID=2839662 RepID=A0A951PEH7_9CYAN|nr:NACHT domain-containing protein [Pegethrix bostrychoides GSE-TBD4-15B]